MRQEEVGPGHGGGRADGSAGSENTGNTRTGHWAGHTSGVTESFAGVRIQQCRGGQEAGHGGLHSQVIKLQC